MSSEDDTKIIKFQDHVGSTEFGAAGEGIIREEIHGLTDAIIEDVVKFLGNEGVDIKACQFKQDLEIIETLLEGALLRQMNLTSAGIDVLNLLEDEDEPA